MRFRNCLVAALMFVGLAGSARADVTYSFSTDATSYTGSTVTVSLYLNETVVGSNVPSLIGPNGTEKGLFAAGVAVNSVGGAATVSNASLNNNTASASSPGFGGTSGTSAGQTNVDSATNSAAVLDQINFGTTAPKAVTVSSSGNTTVNQILLGTVTIAANSGTSTFSVTSFNLSSNPLASAAGDSTNTTPTGYQLDPAQVTDAGGTAVSGYNGTESGNTYTFTVAAAAVPEPSSMLLCGFAVCGMGYTAYRRRKAASELPVVTA